MLPALSVDIRHDLAALQRPVPEPRVGGSGSDRAAKARDYEYDDCERRAAEEEGEEGGGRGGGGVKKIGDRFDFSKKGNSGADVKRLEEEEARATSNQLTHDDGNQAGEVKPERSCGAVPSKTEREQQLLQVLREIRAAVARSDPRRVSTASLSSREETAGDDRAVYGPVATTFEPLQQLTTAQALMPVPESDAQQRALTAVFRGGLEALDPQLSPEHFIALLDEQERQRAARVSPTIARSERPGHRGGLPFPSSQVPFRSRHDIHLFTSSQPSKHIALRPPRRVDASPQRRSPLHSRVTTKTLPSAS